MAARDLDEWQREYGELAGRFVQELGLPLAVMNGNDESIATVESRLRSHVQAAADSWVDASSEQASLRLVLGLSFYLIDILLRRTDGLLRQSKFGDLHVAYSYDTQGRIAARATRCATEASVRALVIRASSRSALASRVA